MSFPDKFLGNVHVTVDISQTENSACEKLLGIDKDCKLSFGNHIR